MLYHLALYAKNYWSFFNVIHYVSFRAIAGLLSTLFCSLLFGWLFIDKFRIVFSAKIRDYVPERHKTKGNMPTMGGIFILAVVTCNALLWCDLTNPKVWLMLACLLGFGAIGCWDDWCKITRTRGITAKNKFF